MYHALVRPSGPEAAIYVLWVVWVLSWFVAAAWSARTQARHSAGREVGYRIITAIGAFMLFFGAPRGAMRIIPASESLGWVLVVVALSGFLFAWWARLHLGALWSGQVTRKEGHRIIDTGPYRFVRHPIYAGIMIACFALAFIKGSPVSIAGALVMTLGWYIKARLEERFLRAELGAEAYDAYARRVPMLLPLIGV